MCCSPWGPQRAGTVPAVSVPKRTERLNNKGHHSSGRTNINENIEKCWCGEAGACPLVVGWQGDRATERVGGSRDWGSHETRWEREKSRRPVSTAYANAHKRTGANCSTCLTVCFAENLN